MSPCHERQCVSMQIRLPHRLTDVIDVAVPTFQLQCCEKQERMLRRDWTSAHAVKQARWRCGDIAAAITSTCVWSPVIDVAWSVSSLPTETSTHFDWCGTIKTHLNVTTYTRIVDSQNNRTPTQQCAFPSCYCCYMARMLLPIDDVESFAAIPFSVSSFRVWYTFKFCYYIWQWLPLLYTTVVNLILIEDVSVYEFYTNGCNTLYNYQLLCSYRRVSFATAT